jgi:predicted MPP superfamily phosphohydrolase
VRLSRRTFLQSGAALTATAVLTDALWIEKHFIEVNEFFIGTAAPETQNIKIVQLSDLHLHSINSALEQLAKKINQLKPDLIAITGDAIDEAENLHLLDDYLSLIDKEISKVAILGNWEYWGEVDLKRLREVYEKHNSKLLVNESKQFQFKEKTLSVIGIDDFVGGYASYKLATDNFVKSNHNIVLNHCPKYSEQIVERCQNDNISFILSGHTHGGQIRLFNIVPFLPQGSGKYVKGWYKQLNPPLYVSKGIGTSILPVRFGSRAEIAVFYLIK